MKKISIVLLLSLVVFVPFIASASFDKSLYYGLQNDSQVKELQEFLTDQGVYSGPITGNFFSLTLKAVKQFQSQQVLPQTGYFGVLSRQKANDILAINIVGSGEEAIQETGTTTPSVEAPKTTNDVVNSLQNQMALLIQQVALLQSQLTVQQQQQITINQIQQNTQKIAQNTCTPSWQCTNWNACDNFQQARVCTDLNSCGVATNKPGETQSCTSLSGGTLTIAVDSALSPSSQTFVKGSANKLISAFKFTAGATEGIKLTKIKLTINNDSGRATDVSNITLWDGSTRVTGPVSVVGKSATFGSAAVGLNASGLIDIPAGSSKTLLVKADIPSGAASGHMVDLDIVSASDVSANGLNLGYSIPSGNITLISGNASPYSIISNGSLTVSLSASTPSAQTYAIGSTGVPFTKINITAHGEDVFVSLITLDIFSNGQPATSDAHLANIKLIREDNGEQYGTATTTVPTASFRGSLTVPASQTITLTAVADIPSDSYPYPNSAIGLGVNTPIATAMNSTGIVSSIDMRESGSAMGNTMSISSGL